MNKARAHHDLNGVDALVITGWRGRYEVQKHAPGARVVSILAPKRHEDEFWTFERTTPMGELRVHSSLIGSPSLLTESAEPMLILLPADLVDRITIRLEG
jgi:hypothetical protein